MPGGPGASKYDLRWRNRFTGVNFEHKKVGVYGSMAAHRHQGSDPPHVRSTFRSLLRLIRPRIDPWRRSVSFSSPEDVQRSTGAAFAGTSDEGLFETFVSSLISVQTSVLRPPRCQRPPSTVCAPMWITKVRFLQTLSPLVNTSRALFLDGTNTRFQQVRSSSRRPLPDF